MSGLKFNITYDQSKSSLPTGFTTAISNACKYLSSQFSSTVTINLHVGYGEVAGSSLVSGAIGASDFIPTQSSYAKVRSALISHATTADAKSAVSSLPASDPTGGGHFWLAPADAVALGLLPASTKVNCYVGFSKTVKYDYDPSNGVTAGRYDFYGIALHEITETMGRVLQVGEKLSGYKSYFPLDLFHYSAAGAHSFTGTKAGYFSIDNGHTHLASFNTTKGADYGDWAKSFGNDSFAAFGKPGVVEPISEVDLKEMNALGYARVGAPAAATSALVASASGASVSSAMGADHFVFNAGSSAGSAHASHGESFAWEVAGRGSHVAYQGHDSHATAVDHAAHFAADPHALLAHLTHHGDFIA
jgi:hypothetical protein